MDRCSQRCRDGLRLAFGYALSGLYAECARGVS
jgi:hypothetical protein